MSQIITKHNSRYKVYQVLPMYNVPSHFSLKNVGRKCAVCMAKYGMYKQYIYANIAQTLHLFFLPLTVALLCSFP